MMDYNTATAKECADWLAGDDGWKPLAHDANGNVTAWINETYASCGVVLNHPYPLTLDSAAGALRDPLRWDEVLWFTASVYVQIRNANTEEKIGYEAQDELTARFRVAVASRLEGAKA